jgi:hypothetical protein
MMIVHVYEQLVEPISRDFPHVAVRGDLMDLIGRLDGEYTPQTYKEFIDAGIMNFVTQENA